LSPPASALEIQGRRIGAGAACFVIAEAGVNHNGQVELAHRLVDAAAEAGADAVKFQTFDPELLAAADAPQADYQRLATTSSASQREMLRELVLPREAHAELARHAGDRGLVFLSSPFDRPAADFLEQLGVPAFKIPSGELTNHRLLAHVARFGKPMLVSTGMSLMEEVASAIAAIRAARDVPLALFHCVSSYPAEPRHANLRAIATLAREFGVPAGWSDHTPGTVIAVAAVALGADLLEKHLTLDRELPGPDHRASLEPGEFARLVREVREVESALGDGRKQPQPPEAAIAAVARKSLHWSVDLPAGTLVTEEHLYASRPGTGLPPSDEARITGRRLREAVRAGTRVREQDLEP
jgi:N-acetylneuraminate synthase